MPQRGRKYVSMEIDEYERMVKEQNDCRLALAAFMAAYGNCDIPGALLMLAHKPYAPPGVTEAGACEAAMALAWIKGAGALGIFIQPNRVRS